jgi:Ca2+-dependent lipid-binding protein
LTRIAKAVKGSHLTRKERIVNGVEIFFVTLVAGFLIGQLGLTLFLLNILLYRCINRRQ